MWSTVASDIVAPQCGYLIRSSQITKRRKFARCSFSNRQGNHAVLKMEEIDPEQGTRSRKGWERQEAGLSHRWKALG